MSGVRTELDAVEQELQASITARQEELAAQLTELVAIPTGRGHADGLEAMRALLVERLEAIGAEVHLSHGDPRPEWLLGGDTCGAPPPCVLCTRAGDGPRILIAGHIDTVHDPDDDFNSLTPGAEGIWRGPGAADMKGGLVVMVAALEALHAASIDANWSVLLNSDEETGSFSSNRQLRAAATEHDLGLVVEPALPDGSLVVERMGSGQFMIDVDGRSAHVGREFERGVSAVKTLAEVMLEVLALADHENGKIVNIGPLEGGGATNAVPDHAACWGNLRFASPEAQQDLAESIDAIEHRWSHHDDGSPHPEDHLPCITIHRTFNRPAKPMTPAVEELAMAARRAAESLGQSLPFAKTGGVCDANLLQAEGLPVIDTLGVRGGNLHRGDEFVQIESLSERASLLAVLIKRIRRGEEVISQRARS
jgi:glutamate carboxypeptidase